MKANLAKCHLFLSKNSNFEANFNENRISNLRFQKLLGEIFDYHQISKISKLPVINFMYSLEFPST